MKDKLFYYIFSLSNKPIINKLLSVYYNIAYKYVAFNLNKMEFVEHAYLKGSYTGNNFIPVISDLDFFICGKKDEANIKKLTSFFKKAHRFFPMVSDFDFHEYEEMDFLRNHSGLKFLDLNNWKTIKGEDTGFSYKFYPRKFKIDLVHEIYFQFEWLFKNLKKRKKTNKYRSICIQRQYQKIQELINFSYKNDSFEVKKEKFVVDPIWFELSNEEIIEKFNILILKDFNLKSILKNYKQELYDLNLEEIVKEKYFVENLELYNDLKDLNFSGKRHYFRKENFELFYLTGCIDSYVIHDWIKKNDKPISNLFIKALYYSRIIENRANTVHNSSFYFDNKVDAKELKNNIYNLFQDRSEPTMDTTGDFVYVIPIDSFHNNNKAEIQSFIDKNKSNGKIILFELVNSEHDSKTISDFENIEHIKIHLESHRNMSRYQMQNLRNLCLDWIFGAEVICFYDLNLAIPSDKDSSIIRKLCSENTFVLPYKSFLSSDYELTRFEFVWAASKESWTKLGYIIDTNLDIYNNEFFYYSVSKELVAIQNANELFQEYIKDNFHEGFEVKSLEIEPVSIKNLNNKSLYNERQLKTSFFNYLKGRYKRDVLNLWVDKEDDQYESEIKDFLNNFSGFTPVKIWEDLKRYNSYEVFKPQELFSLKNESATILTFDTGYSVIENITPDEISLKTGQFEGYKKVQLTGKIPLDKKYNSDIYYMNLDFISQYGLEDESGVIKFKPDGIEQKNSIRSSKCFKTDKISYFLELSEEMKEIHFEMDLMLRGDCSYKFNISDLIKINYDDGFTFFKDNVASSPKPGMFLIHGATQGFYKVVIKLKEKMNALVYLINDDKILNIPKLSRDEDNPVFTFYALESVSDITLYFKGFDNNDIETVHVLKQDSKYLL